MLLLLLLLLLKCHRNEENSNRPNLETCGYGKVLANPLGVHELQVGKRCVNAYVFIVNGPLYLRILRIHAREWHYCIMLHVQGVKGNGAV